MTAIFATLLLSLPAPDLSGRWADEFHLGRAVEIEADADGVYALGLGGDEALLYPHPGMPYGWALEWRGELHDARVSAGRMTLYLRRERAAGGYWVRDVVRLRRLP